MNIVSVIGNGISRNDYNIEKLRDVGPVYGCNYIYEDYHVDNLIACDRHVVEKVLQSGYYTQTNFWTREKWFMHFGSPADVNVFPALPAGDKKWQKGEHWGSGLFALYLACLSKPDIILILGFDLDGLPSEGKNDIYKEKLLQIPNSNTHRKDKPVDASFWKKQFELLFKWNPNTTFSFINLEEWQEPQEWNGYENWTIDNYEVLDQFVVDNKL